MNSRLVTTPELFLIAGTRALLGAGIGLLLADRLTRDQRRAVGWTLLGIGAVTTVPLAAQVLRHRATFDEFLATAPESSEEAAALAGV